MEKRYTSRESFIADVLREKPRVMFMTGKAATGKTTLARELAASGYQLVHLDSLVVNSVLKRFALPDHPTAFTVYKTASDSAWTDSFVEATRHELLAKLEKGPVLVEGGLANNETVKRIFAGMLDELAFVFFLPRNIAAFAERLQKRLESDPEPGKNGFPRDFFSVNKEDVDIYAQTGIINDSLKEQLGVFAAWSCWESHCRLQYFKEGINRITVLET